MNKNQPLPDHAEAASLDDFKEYLDNSKKLEPTFKYFIHVQRESRDDDYWLHQEFKQEMSEGEIVDWLHDYEHPYDPDYNRLTFYEVFK